MLWKGKKPPIKPFFFSLQTSSARIKGACFALPFPSVSSTGLWICLALGSIVGRSPPVKRPLCGASLRSCSVEEACCKVWFLPWSLLSLSVLSPVVWKKSELSRSRPPRARTEHWVSFFCSSGARVVWGWMPLKPVELNQPHSKENRPVGLQNIYPHDFTGFLLLQIHKSLYQPTSKIIKP